VTDGLATTSVPLASDELADVLGWIAERVQAAVGHGEQHPDIGGPVALRLIPTAELDCRRPPRRPHASPAGQVQRAGALPRASRRQRAAGPRVQAPARPAYVDWRQDHLNAEHALRMTGLLHGHLACGLATYPTSRIACSTALRAAGLTSRPPLRTRDTVPRDTPAAAATSIIVGHRSGEGREARPDMTAFSTRNSPSRTHHRPESPLQQRQASPLSVAAYRDTADVLVRDAGDPASRCGRGAPPSHGVWEPCVCSGIALALKWRPPRRSVERWTVELRLLGPVEVLVNGEKLPLGRRQERCLLAILALRAGKFLPIERLADLLWDGRPPDGARAAIQVMISHLRAALRATQPYGTQVLTGGDGYALKIDSRVVDAHRFRTLIDSARTTSSAQDRRDRLGTALSLWRGPALADAADDALRARICADLDELHLAAREDWLQARLDLGEHADVVGDLVQQVSEQPLRERLHGQLMLALYRCGRRADALETYRQARLMLVDELGMEPGADLRALQHAILTDQPSVAFPHPVPTRITPALLPAAVAGFTGRSRQLEALDSFLSEAGENEPTAVVITAIAGTAGVGKSALAVHYAHRVADRFPDGQLYVNLRGFDPTGSVMTSAEAVRTFLDAFCVPAHRIPVSLEAQVGLYRSLLAGRRVLVVLDNARDAEHVRPLLPGSPGCLVVVTSRNQLTSLAAAEGAHPLTLDLLTDAEARQFLVHRLGEDRVAAEPHAVDEIITRCAGLPLALAIVAARAATHPRFALEARAHELRESRGGLGAFGGWDATADVRAVFSWSYRALNPEVARVFRLLGLHPGPDVAIPAVASLAGVSVGQIRSLLAELAQAHLITEHVPGRYTFHDLLRAYAAELTRTTDTDDERHAATHRMLDHYLHTGHAAQALLDRHFDRVSLTVPQPNVIAEDLTGREQALAWFTNEHRALLAAIRHAANTDTCLARYAWQLAWTIANFLDMRGHWHDWAATMRFALDMANVQADREGQARMHRGLAAAYVRMSRFQDAHAHLRQALHLHGELGDQIGSARTHHTLGWAFDREHRYEQALVHAHRALELHRGCGNLPGEAKALNAIGWHHAMLGHTEEALTYCRQALALHQKLGDRRGQAITWDSLGYVHHHLGRHQQASNCYQYSLDLFREVGDRYNEAGVLARLGDTHHTATDSKAARHSWRDALVILEELGHADANEVRAKLDQLDQIDPRQSG
jgi:DNA-binding SARP family transcriptional activator/tetratricopeptide (TPR) repeat protein